MATAPVKDMNSSELRAWLKEKGIDESCCNILTRTHRIDGEEFLRITMDILKDELGIMAWGDRSKIFKLVEAQPQQPQEHEEREEMEKNEPEMMGCLAYEESANKDIVSRHYHPSGTQAASFPYGPSVLWKKNKLRVHFMNSVPFCLKWKIDDDQITRDGILKLANVWRDETRCDSVPKFVRADSEEQSDIRVKFDTKGGSHSRIGTFAEDYPRTETMVLNLGLGNNNYKKHVVRHEFGHALGLGHEHQGKHAPFGLLNKEAVVEWLMKVGKMTKEEAEKKYDYDYKKPRPTQYPNETATRLDLVSIMQYWIHKDWINKDHPYALSHLHILEYGINNPPKDTPSDMDLQETTHEYTKLTMNDPNGPLSTFLMHNGLTGHKWVTRFHQHNITKQDQIIVEDKKMYMYRALSRGASFQEQAALKRILKMVDHPVSPINDIEVDLVKTGLDPFYWSPIFAKQLGVTSAQGMQYVGGESYPTLQLFARKQVEKKALQKMLKMEDEESTFRKQREKLIQKLKKRQEESEQILQQLKSLQEEGKDRRDPEVFKMEDCFRERLQIPPDSWFSDCTTLYQVIDQLEGCQIKIDRILKTKEEISELSVIQNTRGCLAMTGVLLTKKHDDQLLIRDVLIKAPRDIHLMGPSHSQHDKIKQFTSKQQEDEFTKTVDRLGYSVVASSKAGFWGFTVEASINCSQIKERNRTSEHHEEEMYHSTVKYSVMPLASCYFSDTQLQLSDDAIKYLQQIEELDDPRHTLQQSKCEEFFQKFGSHASKGPLHFGGMYQWKSYSRGFNQSDTMTIQKFQSEIINMQVGMSHGGFAAASMAVSKSNLQEKLRGKYSGTLISQTFLEVTKTGGPPEASGLPEWKNGLIASNSTWSVIDRGTTLVPVWDIIKMNHMKDFQKPEQLAIAIRQAWIAMNQYYSEHAEQKEDEDAVKVMEDLKSLISSGSRDMSGCTEKLHHLVEVKQKLTRESMNPQAWPSLYLSQPPIQQFLTSVVTSCSQQSSPMHKSLRLSMRQLVEPTDLGAVKNFPEPICRWLYGTKSSIVPIEYQDFLHLQKYFKYALDDMYNSVTRSDAKLMELAIQPDISMKATITVAKTVSHLRIHLRRVKQNYEDIFITTMLFPFKYDPDKYIFLTLFSACDLEYLCEEFENQSTSFFTVMKHKGLINLQAFLFLLAVKLYKDLDVNESQIKAQLQYIEQKIGNKINPQVEDILTELRSNNFDWEWFQSRLDSVVESGHLTQGEEGQPLNVILATVKEIKSLPNEEDRIIGSKQTEEFFSMLGLTDFYPQKLTLAHALQIREDTLQDFMQDLKGKNTDTHQQIQQMNPNFYPFFILQKIMAFDYKSRMKFSCSSTDKPSSVAKGSNGGMHDDFSDSEEDDEVVTVHPMDGLLALLHCSNNFLRQDLMSRLATCQLAIPFLLPDPFTHQVNFPLWGMRSIIKEWKVIKNGKTTSFERPLIECQAPLVSFLRFGKLEVSKSQILNLVISDSGHDSFCHYNCDGGSFKQHLVHGLVEVFWYLPSDKIFPDVVSFANLHGDAREFSKQVKFLSKASFMNFVFLNTEDLDVKAILVLEELATAPGGVVVLRTKPTEDKALRERLKLLQQSLSKEKFSGLKRDKSEADFKNTIREKINQKLYENWTDAAVHCCTIEGSRDIARKCEVVVDEDDKDCIKGKELANDLKTIVDKFASEHPDESIKQQLLLQGNDLWHKWAMKDKEQYRQTNRGHQPVEDYGALQRKEMKMIRKKQLTNLQSLSPLMNLFLKHLLSYQGNIRNYFLQWLKLMLDNLSREQLPVLHSRYNQMRIELSSQQQEKVDDSAEKVCRKRMEELNQKLIHASFGLKHLLREVSQIYEAVVSDTESKPEHTKIFQLPDVAAELLINGYPLELMDGDAAHVPMKWVSAVLDKLQEKLCNPSLFVLSILGLQSTGKSTLMNAVFGLRFSVSAGRCTRGAFMQLLPVNEGLKQECKCDYFLIVDTEGLRAPELDTLRAQKHDNELATFVIGVANLTVINIYGEVAGAMDDILQTAVHAFLRMKEVKLAPSCHFVHHIVSSVMAGEKGIMGRFKFKEKLDQMTQAAAKEEKLEGHFSHFNQVIEFNDDHDVSYFPSLWKGDPPMAPVNPGYSTRAQIIKSHFIDISKQRVTQPLSVYKQCLEELWKAILHENFVFSFRNTSEIAAYNTLETEYGQWSWSFQEKMMKWNQKAQNELNTVEAIELSKVHEKLTSELTPHVQNLYEGLKGQMNRFFKECPDRATMIQWRANTEIRLNHLHRQLHASAKDDLKQLFTSRQALVVVDERKTSHRRNMLDHVKELVSRLEKDRLKEGLPNDEQLERIFNEQWSEWIKDLLKSIPVYKAAVNVNEDVQTSLLEALNQQRAAVIHELTDKPLQQWGLSLKLTVQPVHFQFLGFWNKSECKQIAQQVTDDILDKVKNYLQLKQDQNYNSIFIHELLRILKKEISDFHSEEFAFTTEYSIHIALTACGYALKEFEQMVEAFRKKHDPVEYLQKVRKPFFEFFKDQYSQVAQERTAACILCDLLLIPVRKQVINSLSLRIVDDMRGRSAFFHTKRALKAKILCDIAERLQQNGSFDDCALYLTNVKQSLLCWLERYTIQHCREGNPSRLVQLAKSELSILVTHIEQTACEVTQEFSQTSPMACIVPEEKLFDIINWLNRFYGKLRGRLEIDVTELRDLGGIQQLTNIRSFKEEVSKELQRLESTLQDEFMHMDVFSMQWEKKPYHIHFQNLSGCTEQCPFCKEQCDLNDDSHVSTQHSVKMHRPQCLGSCKWKSSGEMVVDVCSSLVGTDSRFRNNDTNNEWYLYKEYQKLYPRWSIIDDKSLEASSYWKWVLSNYTSEVARLFNMKEAQISSEWKSMSWNSVKKDLEKAYNVTLT